MRFLIVLLAVLIAPVLQAETGAVTASDQSAVIPAGVFKPFYAGKDMPVEIPVKSFRLAITPVTNALYLEFVKANPRWRRSAVKRIFADEGYLKHWKADLDYGDSSSAKQPVVHVSWFAAKAYSQWLGGRLPTNAEWEMAAAAGYVSADGRKEPAFFSDLNRWYSTPSPASLPAVASGKASFHGIHDLHGLVWEWTSDFNSAMVTGDARGDNGPDRQLFCGAGSLDATDRSNFAAFMRYGFRSSLKAAYTVHNLGFRCAYDL